MSQLIREGQDGTLARNNMKYMQHLASEYELIKKKQHPRYRFAEDFYKAHGLKRQNFIKYYNRYKSSNDPKTLLPQKRGPKYKLGRTPGFIENKVIDLRMLGKSRYQIHYILKEKLKKNTPSCSTIYNICKRNNLNRLRPKMKQNKRRIIKERMGELGHIDCHYLPKGIIENDSNRYYFVAVVDSCSRIAWCELVKDITSLTVMFAVLKMFNTINSEFNIEFEEVLTDNGPEFGGGKDKGNASSNPFKRMLSELGVKHRHTKPYRPQTNGKVERFWKTINEDLLEDVVFDSFEHLKDELLQYVVYYNHARPHQGIDGNTPAEKAAILSSK